MVLSLGKQSCMDQIPGWIPVERWEFTNEWPNSCQPRDSLSRLPRGCRAGQSLFGPGVVGLPFTCSSEIAPSLLYYCRHGFTLLVRDLQGLCFRGATHSVWCSSRSLVTSTILPSFSWQFLQGSQKAEEGDVPSPSSLPPLHHQFTCGTPSQAQH